MPLHVKRTSTARNDNRGRDATCDNNLRLADQLPLQHLARRHYPLRTRVRLERIQHRRPSLLSETKEIQ
jgi:hypothetical protein